MNTRIRRCKDSKDADRPLSTPILITRPHLPSIQTFVERLEVIWASRILTNNGPFHHDLERALANYWQVPYVSLFCNGTLAMIAALKALDIQGEVITTPFSFLATSHCLSWCGISPVFCDISPDGFTLDPLQIERSITPHTSAIVPVHVYGYPCKCEEIEQIAARHSLKVIYDAAHAFGVSYQGESLMKRGDGAMISFHATKLFNTIEGGAVACRSLHVKRRMDYFKNHGIVNDTTTAMPGLNAKMTELQAALGLLQLEEVALQIQRLQRIHGRYHELLAGCAGISLPHMGPNSDSNYAYFPILINKTECGHTRDFVYRELRRVDIHARRYFYPLLSDLHYYRHLPSAQPRRLPNARKASREVLCLPNYSDLPLQTVEYVCERLREVLAMPA